MDEELKNLIAGAKKQGANDNDIKKIIDMYVADIKKKEPSKPIAPKKQLESLAQPTQEPTLSATEEPQPQQVSGGLDGTLSELKIQPKPGTVLSTKNKIESLKKELASVKVTPKNQEEVSRKTDELSFLINKDKEVNKERLSNLEKTFKGSFNKDAAVAESEKRLNDLKTTTGVWNNIKSTSIDIYNKAIEGAAALTDEAGIKELKIDVDPLSEFKKEAKLKSKVKLSPQELNAKAEQLYKDREVDNIETDNVNSFLDNLDDNDRLLLRQLKKSQAEHLNEDNLKQQKVINAYEVIGNKKIDEFENLKKQLLVYKNNNQPLPKDLYDSFVSIGNEVRGISADIQKRKSAIDKNKSDLGTVNQEFDFLKRQYGDVDNAISNIGLAGTKILNGIIGFTNYAANFGGGAQGQLYSLAGQQVAQDINNYINDQEDNLRKEVKSIESAEGFVNYASDLVAKQIPNLLVASTGIGGLGAIGMSSTGEKFTNMNQEVLDGKASYSPMQMAVAPVLYGGAEVISEIPTASILKKGSRVFESIIKNESDLITKSVKEKAKEWAKDYGIDMSKELAGEEFTNFTQNFTDKYVLGKKDVGLLDNTGTVFKDTFTLTSILKAAPHIAGAILKPLQKPSDLTLLDENSRKIIEFSKQLNSEALTSVEKSVINDQIKKATVENSKIIANTINQVDNMPDEVYKKIIELNDKAAKLKTDAIDISNGNLPNKDYLIDQLKNEYRDVQTERTALIDAKYEPKAEVVTEISHLDDYYKKVLEDEKSYDWEKEQANEYFNDKEKFIERDIEIAKRDLLENPESEFDKNTIERREKALKELETLKKEEVVKPITEKVVTETVVKPEVISPETSSNYANLTEDKEGDFVFFHVGGKGYDKIKKSTGGTLATSKEEGAALGKVGGVAMYYTRPGDTESMVKGDAKYAVTIPKEKVYDANTDANNYTEEAKTRHEEEHPGKAFDSNTKLAYITKIAGENGYDMVVSEWMGKTRAQTTKEFVAKDVQLQEGNKIVKPFQEEYVSNTDLGYESIIPESKYGKFDSVYKKIREERNKENVYDDLYQLYGKDTTNIPQEDITKLVEESDLSQEVKDMYAEALAYEPGIRRTEVPFKPVTIENVPEGDFLNIGLNIGTTAELLDKNDVISMLPKGVKVLEEGIYDVPSEIDGKKNIERTLLVKLSRPLTKAEMTKLLEDTQQKAIPQLTGGKGLMYGSKEWGNFDPEYFHLPKDGKLADFISKKPAVEVKPTIKSKLAVFKTKYIEKPVYDRAKLNTQVENAKKSLSKLLPDVKFVVHDTEKSYENATGESGSGGMYIMSSNGDKVIHINSQKTNGRTVAHEVFHAIILDKIGGDKSVQDITKRMIDAVYKTASPELKAELDAFASRYTDKTIRDEEKLAELIGIMADGYPQMSAANKSVIKRWLDSLAKVFGLKPFTDNEVIDLLNVIASNVSTGDVILDEKVSMLGYGSVEIKKDIKRESKFIDSLIFNRFPTNKNTKVIENFDLSKIDGQVAGSTLSDKLTAGELKKYKTIDGEDVLESVYTFLGGVGYPEVTGYVWAASEESGVKKIIDVMKVSSDGYRYLIPAVMSNVSHMSNKNMTSITMEVFKEAINNKELNRDTFKKVILKAFDKKEVKRFKEGAIKAISGNISAIDMADKLRDYVISSKMTFESRRGLLEGMVGNSEAGNPKFSTVGTFLSLAKSLTEPIAKDAELYQVPVVIRTKGNLTPVKTNKEDKFYHESYGYHIESDQEIEVLHLDGVYNLTDIIPEFIKEDGTTVSTEKELKEKGAKGWDIKRILTNLGRTHGLSKYSAEIVAKKQQTEKTIIRKQIVGENANLSQNVRDNLDVARDMESSKKSDKEIRLATGWERGADKKWRYEVPDIKFKKEFEGDFLFPIDKLKRIPSGLYVAKLSDLFDAEDLFKLYNTELERELPLYREDGSVVKGGVSFKNFKKLEDINVYFEKGGYSEGSYDLIENDINISFKPGNSTNEEILVTIAHEIQHYIQDREGFARGGNINETKYLTIEKLINEIEQGNDAVIYNKIQSLLEKSKIDQVHDLLNKYSIKKYNKKIDRAAYDLYIKYAGEVESRNVERRINATPEARRKNTLQETEDVAREDQIIFFKELKRSQESEDYSDMKEIVKDMIDEGMSISEIKKIVTEELGPYSVSMAESAYNELTTIKEKPTVKEEPFKGKQKERSVLKRIKEGGNAEYINEIIDKIGINYTQRNQQQVIADAEAFVDEVGIENAYEAIKNGSINNGDSVTVVYASIIDRIPSIAENAIEDAKTEPEKEAVKKEYNELLETIFDEFSKRQTDIGQATAILNALYIKNQEVMYSLSVQKEKYKAINAGVIDEETLKKFEALDKRYTAANKKIKELESKLKESVDEQNFKNIVEEYSRVTSKENIGSKARNLAKDIRSGKKAILPSWAVAEGAKGGKTQGITFEKTFAKALETFADVHDATKDFAKAIEEGFKVIKQWYANNNIDFNEKDIKSKFSEYVNPKAKKLTVTKGVIKIPSEIISNYVANGGSDINELSEQILNDSKDEYPNLTVREIRDNISKYGSRLNKTRTQLAEDILRLKSLGRLESQLEDLKKGISKSKNEVKKRALSDLEKKYMAQIKSMKNALGITETERTTANENYIRRRIEQLKEKIKNNDFAKKEVTPIKESEELKKLKTEKNRVQEEYDKIIYTKELENRTVPEKITGFLSDMWDAQRVTRATGELSFVGAQGGFYMINSTFSRKTFNSLVKNFRGTSLSDWTKSPIKTISNIIRSATSAETIIEMFNKMGTKNNYDDYQALLKAHPYYDVFIKSKLRILSEDIKTQVRDEMFIGNHFLHILKLPFTALTKLEKGKKRITVQGYYERLKTGKVSDKNIKTTEEIFEAVNPLGVFERGNNTFMNMARVEMFMDGVQALEMQGKNPIDHLEDYKKLASAVNTVTGSGNLVKSVAMSLPILNKIFFSPRFWAASLNMTPPISLYYLAKLGNYDSVTLSNPKSWGSIRPTVAQKAFIKPMLKGFIAFYGMSALVVSLINAALDDDDEMTEEEKTKKRAYIEYDPRSSNFMQVISGDTRTDFFGPYRNNMVLFSRLFTGQTSKDGNIIENGAKWGSRTDFQIGSEYIAGKANPFPGMFVRYSMGKKEEVLNKETKLKENKRMLFDDDVSIANQTKENLLPIFVGTVKDIVDEDPVLGSAFYTTLALFGKQTSVYKKKVKSKMSDEELKKLNPRAYEKIKALREKFNK